MSRFTQEFTGQKIKTQPLLAIIAASSTAMSYWGYQSLWPSIEGKVLASIMAAATFASLFLFHTLILKALTDTAQMKNKLAVLALALAFFPFIIGLSSAINVAAISGKAAQVVYLSDFEKQLTSEKTQIFQRANAVRKFLPLFEQEANAWTQAAEDERHSGAFSQSAGTGAVHTTLKNYAASFERLHTQTETFLNGAEKLNAQADQELLNIRQVIDQNLPPEQRMKAVAAHADKLNSLLIKMQGRDLIDGFKITALNLPNALKAITLSRNASVANGQQDAINKITARLENSLTLLTSAFDEYQESPSADLPKLQPMSILRAVIVYWHLFPQSWLAGLAFDLLPLFLAVVILVLNASKTDAEIQNEIRMAQTVGEIMNSTLSGKQMSLLARNSDILSQINNKHFGLKDKSEEDKDNDK